MSKETQNLGLEGRADADLVAAARTGDRQAFDLLYDRYVSLARSVARDMVANEEIAHELAQEAMLQAYLSLAHLRDGERFRSWLHGIVRNVCRSHLRDRKRDCLSLESLTGGLRLSATDLAGASPDPEELAEERELRRAVLAAVNDLSPKYRAATLLFYYEQRTLQEIAAILEVSLAAVKGRLYRARQNLREHLQPLYAERSRGLTTTRRRQRMVMVTIGDVLTNDEQWIVALLDETGRRALLIWIGMFEAYPIAVALRGSPTPRPLTFDFAAKLLEASGATLEEVQIAALKENTYYAIAKLRTGQVVQELDARPSDALALAARTGSPISVAEEVWSEAGVDVPAEGGLAQVHEIVRKSSEKPFQSLTIDFTMPK